MNSYIEIIRPGNVVMAVIAVVLVAIVADSYTIPVLLGMLSVFFAISGGNVINDVFDYKIDSINRPDRPIPSGRISLENARKYAYLLFILSVLVSFITSYLVQSIYPTVVVLFAGGLGRPQITTDTTVAKRALEMNADVILAGKNGVDGVYTADPNKDKNAKFIKNISYSDVLKNNLKVMDKEAIELLKESDIATRVFSMENMDNFIKVIKGDDLGTTIAKE